MVKLSTPALVSLLAASVAAADLRAAYRGHKALHYRGETHSPITYESTFPLSKPSKETGYPTGQPPKDTSEDTTCTEESTKPVPETQPSKSYPTKPYPESSYPAETTHKTYPESKTYPSKTYETSSTPAESTYESTTCTEESTSESKTYESKTYESKTYESKTYESKTYESKTYESKTYQSKTYESKTYESKTYETSVPASKTYESKTYETSIPASETYESKTYESSYPESSPLGETSTYWETQYSTHYQTVTGGSAYPTKPAPEEECPTVTITVTAGQEHPKPVPTYSAAPQKPAPQKPYPQKPEHESYSKAPAPHTTAKPKPENNVGKRGIAYATIPTLNVGSATNLHWAHNWAAAPTGLPEGIDYVPMCKDESMESEFQQHAEKATHLMSFNEVDMTSGGGGTAKSPQEAAASYKKIMMPYAGTHKLGAPSVTSHDSENSYLNGVSSASGLAYLKQFAAACEGCQVDFACLHWYGGGEDAHTQAQLFKTYMTNAIATVQKLWPGCKVWVDEFSAAPTIDKDGSGVNKQFMEYVLPWLDSQPDIERYSYFAATPGLMANADGSLTEIGQTYASS